MIKTIEEFKGIADSKSYMDWIYKSSETLRDYQSYVEAQNKVWYSGDPAIIRAFFTRTYSRIGGYNPNENGFWRNVSGSVSLVHLPIASSISETMSNILFGRMPKIQADTKNKSNNKKIDAELEKIFDYNNIEESLQTASQLESYSGTVACKIVLDEDFEMPIIKWYPAELIRENSKYGKVVEVCFKDTINENKNVYTLKTFAGFGYIRYELWKKEVQVPMSECKQVSKLKNIFFVDKDGNPIKLLMTIWKQNRVANNIFETCKGSSDYEGLNTIFDSIDETASAMIDVVKKSRIYTFIPERMLAKDENGRVRPNKAYGVDVWDVNKINEQSERLPQRDYVPINVTPYVDAIRSLLMMCLNRVGLSPATMGLDDSGANASGEALNIRDQKTEKTFNDKSKLWKSALEQLAKLLMIFNYCKGDNVKSTDNGVEIPQNILDLKFVATFPPYREISAQDKFGKWVDMLDNGAITLEYAIRDSLQGEIPDADLENILNELGLQKSEQGGNEETEDLEEE